MSLHRRAARRDANEQAIIDALTAAGASVRPLSDRGAPDLCVGFRGVTYLLEVKHRSATGKTVRRTSNGKRPDERGLTEDQAKWWDGWRGVPPQIVRTPEEALRAIGAIQLELPTASTHHVACDPRPPWPCRYKLVDGRLMIEEPEGTRPAPARPRRKR